MSNRIHFKGRGKKTRPTCPHCQQDLKRSYEYCWNPETKKGKFEANGWECKKDKYKQWD
jgi:predicted amidophosphoribosyltransferase